MRTLWKIGELIAVGTIIVVSIIGMIVGVIIIVDIAVYVVRALGL